MYTERQPPEHVLDKINVVDGMEAELKDDR